MKLDIHIPYSKQIDTWRLDEAVELWNKQQRIPDGVIVTDFDTFSGDTNVFSPSRSRNVAIKQTTADYLVFTDADIRPQHNLLQVVEDTLTQNPNSLLMCMRYDLPPDSNVPGIDYDKDFDKWARRGETHAAPGSLQVISVDWLKKVGGFDERYTGWGYFDCEILRRSSMDCVEQRWIEGKTSILHVYHEIYPYRQARERENRALYDKGIELVANQGKEWGQL